MNTKSVIDKYSLENHAIDKYKFKVLSMGGETRTSVFAEEEVPTSPTPSAPAADTSETPPVGGGSRDELVESLLKKADDMSSNVIKMQMKIEEMEAVHKAALETERAKAFEEGAAAGREAALSDEAIRQREVIERFNVSVKTLETQAGEFSKALEGIKGELLHAALDIAKEVVAIELSERSGKIASTLAAQLIAELQEASKVTLRVNPADHGPVSEAVGSLDRVEVVSDGAVSRGGVVAISDTGNIDAEVMKRFERVKNAALSG